MTLLLTTISRCSKYVILGLYYFQFSMLIVTVLVDVILTCFRLIPNVTILRFQPCLVSSTLYITPSYHILYSLMIVK